jgi:hypothetical protein
MTPTPEINREAYARMFRTLAETYHEFGEGDREWLLKEADRLDPPAMTVEQVLEEMDGYSSDGETDLSIQARVERWRLAILAAHEARKGAEKYAASKPELDPDEWGALDEICGAIQDGEAIRGDKVLFCADSRYGRAIHRLAARCVVRP